MNTITILLLLGGLGGILPDVLRVIKDNSKASDYKKGVKIISLVLQVGVGVLAVYLLMVLDLKDIVDMSSNMAIKAIGLGFAAPELITRAISVSTGSTAEPTEPSADNMMKESFKPSVKTMREWWSV